MRFAVTYIITGQDKAGKAAKIVMNANLIAIVRGPGVRAVASGRKSKTGIEKLKIYPVNVSTIIKSFSGQDGINVGIIWVKSHHYLRAWLRPSSVEIM